MRTLTFSLAISALTLALGATSAQATMIDVDPGTVGTRIVTLNFNLAAAATEIDLKFTDMKHLEYGLALMPLTLARADGVAMGPSIASGFLSDEFGGSISGTILAGSVPGVPSAMQFMYEFPVLAPSSVTFHDMHFTSTTGGAWNPGDFVLTFNLPPGAGLNDRPLVGEWAVPEPATLALLAIGFAGIGASRRKSR